MSGVQVNVRREDIVWGVQVQDLFSKIPTYVQMRQPYNTQWQFLQEVPSIEVYIASNENEVFRPAFATEKGGS